jgi:hypothetical protein
MGMGMGRNQGWQSGGGELKMSGMIGGESRSLPPPTAACFSDEGR